MNPRDTAIEALEKALDAASQYNLRAAPVASELQSAAVHALAALRSEVHEEKWISVKDESKLPPIHEEPFAEDGFVLILLQCADWPGKYKTMKASRTIGDWAEDGSPLWFWTDEEGEIIDDDDELITHWMPIPQPPKP